MSNNCDWGILGWSFLHIISLNYRSALKKEYKHFLICFSEVLPDLNSRLTFKRVLEEEMNCDCFRSRLKFVNFISRLHNIINSIIGKKKLNNTQINSELRKFESARATGCNKKGKLFSGKFKDKGCTENHYVVEPGHSSIKERHATKSMLVISKKCLISKKQFTKKLESGFL